MDITDQKWSLFGMGKIRTLMTPLNTEMTTKHVFMPK
jgi:hypothetical protein